MTLTHSLVVLATLLPGQAPAPDFYHDFRGGRPLPPNLSLFGLDAEEVVKPEDGGLRITPPVDGKQTFGWGVSTQFTLSGDFEVTGTYELLSVEPPVKGKGGGVGVALNVLPNADPRKFAKVGRFVRAEDGDVYVAQFWNKDPPKDHHWLTVPTETLAGQLRLVRKGSTLHYLVADGPGDDFREIAQWEYGTEDLSMVRFIANNNSSPTALDARLVDLKINCNSLIPHKAFDESKAGLSLALLLGLLVPVLLLIALGAWFYARQRHRAAHGQGPNPAPPAAPVAVECSGCGKDLKVKAELAGRKVRCPQCGQAVLVPASKVGEA
jgi:ribosomal protein S27E